MPRRSPAELQLDDMPELLTLHAEAGLRLRLAEEPELTHLFWEATPRAAAAGAAAGRLLSTEEFIGIAEVIALDFDISRMTISIGGGEPLRRDDLVEVIGRLVRLGARRVRLITGALLDRERGRRLADAGLDVAAFSVDEDGSLSKSLDAIAAARDAGLLVEAITRVRPADLRRLEELEQLLRSAGATRWRLTTAAVTDPALWLEPRQVRRLFHFIERLRRETGKLDASFSCGGFVGVGRERALRPQAGQCFAGLNRAVILCDGQVSGCPSLPRSWAQGSALETRFTQIWYTRFDELRDFAWRRTGVCEGCGWFQLCLGGGLHERLAAPGAFCWLARQGCVPSVSAEPSRARAG